jgi:cytochrome c-type biogenesis protein
MDSYLAGVGIAFGYGVTMSMSPCPLATNIAAMSFVARRMASPRHVLIAGLLYTFGRVLTYVGLACVLVAGMLSVPAVSQVLENVMNKVLGPLLILVGMLLLELLTVTRSGGGVSEALRGRVERAGIWGALLLGVLFALSFCPISAGLFFLTLIPLAFEHHSAVGLPFVFAVGTALPMVVFAVAIAYGANAVGRVFDKITVIDRWTRRIAGIVFIGAGIYMSLVYVFHVL